VRPVVLGVALLIAVISVSASVTDIERDVVTWLNVARNDPARMIAKLEEILPNFDAASPMLYRIPNDPVAVLTNEGKAAVLEAIKDLKDEKKKRTLPMPVLTLANGLCNAAQDHAKDQGVNGVFSHAGTDGSTPWSRIARYGVWKTTAAENMGTGYNNGLDIVRQLLIDDGETDRGHRKNILNPALTRVGVAVRPHSQYGFVCVQEFSGTFTDNSGIREP